MFDFSSLYRDCTANNIMLDPSGMYPNGFHPTQMNRNQDFSGRAKRHTRTLRPPRYFLIDFSLSLQCTSRDAFDEPLSGGDKSAPEHVHGDRRRNPFKTDIYYLGNLVRQKFIRVTFATAPPKSCQAADGMESQKYHGFEFMHDLFSDMTHRDPSRKAFSDRGGCRPIRPHVRVAQ